MFSSRSLIVPMAAIGLVAGALVGPRAAQANGRFPASISVNFRPADADDLYVGTTFGLLVSHDDGGHFYWVCEKALGYEGSFDPNYRIAIDGTIYASTYDGLRVSRDGGCTFTTATESLPVGDPGRIAGVWVDDVDVGPTGEVWVVTAEGGRTNDVFRSIDAAQTFMPTGLVSSVIWWKSVLVSPADARRVYVTGYQVSQTDGKGDPIPPQVHLRRTDDAGGQWETLSVDSFQLATSPLVLLSAVDPTRPDVLYLRSVRAVPPQGDILYRSADGGRTWAPVLTTRDTINDVVIRGQEVLVATKTDGTYRSTDDGMTYTPVANPPQAQCMGDRAGTLFSCGANWDPDNFSIGRSADAAGWTKVFRFVELKGPLACPAGTVQHDDCDVQQWPMVRDQFGIPIDAGVDAGMEPPPGEPGGCCDASGAGAVPVAAVVLLVGVGAWRVRRRKRGDCCR
ncbi:MAG TPA: hypothetical protein VHE35_28010 [Kofleriaceae bacterium]|nr:hypothetical protein [Kofleriaceae bacterium]